MAPRASVGYGGPVTRTLIVAHETVCRLLEAHASMAAWYHQVSGALRAAGGSVEPPDEPLRLAFIQQIGTHFPDLAEVARGIEHPRAYIPPPAFVPRAGTATDEEPAPAAPAQAGTSSRPADPPAAAVPAATTVPSTPPHGAVAPPPLVDPNKVRY